MCILYPTERYGEFLWKIGLLFFFFERRLVCCLRASMSKVHKFIGLVWMIYGRKIEDQGAQE